VTLADVVARAPDALSAGIDGEVVALDVARGACYGLDPIASRIWSLIETPTAIGEVCRVLVAEYDVDPAICETDVLDLLADLCVEGLVVIHAAPAAASP
jgi:hypothetical protein